MADQLLFNPSTYDPARLDPATRRLLRAMVDWFEESVGVPPQVLADTGLLHRPPRSREGHASESVRDAGTVRSGRGRPGL
ncbi:hypothetical protein [Streptomyces sp. NPDC014006]|uniref:hypothetical protein n=1 Tax=Streptomyces sp. NPDC014006 TaxID=3364870 RepID=UPI0036FBE222